VAAVPGCYRNHRVLMELATFSRDRSCLVAKYLPMMPQEVALPLPRIKRFRPFHSPFGYPNWQPELPLNVDQKPLPIGFRNDFTVSTGNQISGPTASETVTLTHPLLSGPGQYLYPPSHADTCPGHNQSV